MNGTVARLTSDGVTGTATAHEGGFYRFQYDVTGLLNYSTNNSNAIVVTVNGDSTANTSVNNAERKGDYWNFSGIFRPVYLEAFPAQSVSRVAINAKADGTFNMDAYLVGITTADSVSAQIQDLSGNAVGAPFTTGISGGTTKVHLAVTIPSPLFWTAETPNLYQVAVALKQGASVLHTVTQRFGFRTMEVRSGDGIYVNGSDIVGSQQLPGTTAFGPKQGFLLTPSGTIITLNVPALSAPRYSVSMTAARSSKITRTPPATPTGSSPHPPLNRRRGPLWESAPAPWGRWRA